jgi:hypothetical protein
MEDYRQIGNNLDRRLGVGSAFRRVDGETVAGKRLAKDSPETRVIFYQENPRHAARNLP